MWNTILFDLDGTLTDSGEGIMKSVRYALQKEFQIEVEDYRQLREFVGPPLKEQFMAYAGLSEEDGDRAVRAYRERYTAKGIYENRLDQGASCGPVPGRLPHGAFLIEADAVLRADPAAFRH